MQLAWMWFEEMTSRSPSSACIFYQITSMKKILDIFSLTTDGIRSGCPVITGFFTKLLSLLLVNFLLCLVSDIAIFVLKRDVKLQLTSVMPPWRT